MRTITNYTKVISSIIDAETMKHEIRINYSIIDPLEVRLISVGDNDNYLIKASDNSYILRIYKYKKHWLPSKEYHFFEMDLLNFLNKSGLAVSYPIERNDSKYLGTINAPEGERYWTVLSFARGTNMRFNAKNCYKYGKIIAEMHFLTNNFMSTNIATKIDINFLLDLPLQRILRHLDGQRAQDLAYLKNLVASLRETIHIFNEKQFPYEWGVIGGDFHGGNHFCTKNGDITLFDFDLCGFGWRTYDLAIFKWALFNVCRRAPRVKNRALLWQAFLEGYRSIKELNQDQISMIAPFVQARQVWLMGSETTYPDKTLNRKYWDEMFEGLKTALDTVGTDS